MSNIETSAFISLSRAARTLDLIPSAARRMSAVIVEDSPFRGLMTRVGLGENEVTVSIEVEKWNFIADSFLHPS